MHNYHVFIDENEGFKPEVYAEITAPDMIEAMNKAKDLYLLELSNSYNLRIVEV